MNVSNCEYGIRIDNSLFVKICYVNFLNNSLHAFISDAYLCLWIANYWDNWKVPLPKPIIGSCWLTYPFIGYPIPWIQFDWHPLMQPYEW